MDRPLRVCTVPGDHLFVERVLHGAPGVHRVPDPAGPAPGWRPSPALEPSWIRAHADEIDVLHVHFGFEHRTPAQLQEWAEQLARIGIPLVLTVHDLDNPHLRDQRPHHESLRVLTAAAARILTLTRSAAQQILARYDVPAVVVPHPHQFDAALVGRRAQPRCVEAPRVGLILRAIRPNVDPLGGLHLLDRIADHAETVVRGESDLTSGADALGRVLRDGVRRGRWSLEPVAGRTDDQSLWEWLSGLDALVLPYRWGTHSGWIESCHDVDTSVIAPPIGCYVDQHSVTTLSLDAPASEVGPAIQALRPTGIDRDARLAERVDIAASHAALYREVLG